MISHARTNPNMKKYGRIALPAYTLHFPKRHDLIVAMATALDPHVRFGQEQTSTSEQSTSALKAAAT
jgi:hypothetical protein